MSKESAVVSVYGFLLCVIVSKALLNESCLGMETRQVERKDFRLTGCAVRVVESGK